MLVVVCHPDFQRPDEGQASGPLLPPEACFCERPPDSLGMRIPCRMVIAGEGWLNPPGAAGLHDGQRGWLAAVVTHPGHALGPSSRGELAADRHVQSCQPMPGGTGHPSVIPDDLFRAPIQHQHEIHLPKAFHHDLGHLEAPPLLRCGRPGLTPARRPLGVERRVGLDSPVVCPHHPTHALLMDSQALHDMHVRPEPPGAPTRVLGLEPRDAGEQGCLTLGHLERPPPRQPSHSALLFRSRVSSPPRVLSLAFSRARRASFRSYGGTSKVLAAGASNGSRH
jgi:hypothetical protein